MYIVSYKVIMKNINVLYQGTYLLSISRDFLSLTFSFFPFPLISLLFSLTILDIEKAQPTDHSRDACVYVITT